MSRQVFHKINDHFGNGTVGFAILPFWLGLCKNALLLASLLTPVAVGSPMIAQPKSDDATMLSFLMTDVARPGTRESQTYSEFLAPALVLLAPLTEASAQSTSSHIANPVNGQNYERYPYLLLTAGLILLALRPASPPVTGRL